CALLNTGQIACWGSDVFGQLGNGVPPTDDQPSPHLVGRAGAPATVTATAPTPGEVVLTWTPGPESIFGAVTAWLVEHTTDNGATWTVTTTTPDPTPEATITGLANGTTYRFRISAINAVGTGYPTTSNQVTPTAAPTATITTTASSPTSADTISFAITFDQPVTNFDDPADLTLATTATVTATLGTPAGAGTDYTVDVTDIIGDGTIALTLAATTDTVNANHQTASSTPSAAVEIDNTGPTPT